MTELKPCPFCGGKTEVCEGGINGRMRVYGLVEHKDGCFFLADGLPIKYQHIMEGDFDAWNTRAERTCEFVSSRGPDRPPVCSACGYELDVFDCEWFEGGTYGYSGNYCPHCGAKVVGSDETKEV